MGMASFCGPPQCGFVWNEPSRLPASGFPTELRDSLPMYVSPQSSPPWNVTPAIAAAPAHIPLPDFIDVHSKANGMENFSDTSSTTCTEDELASKSASQVNLRKVPMLGSQGFGTLPLAPKRQLASKPGSKKPCWQLVWCCERCNKLSNSETKSAFQNIAERLGGRLHCLKKAQKIQTHSVKCDYVLVADWRESKPLVDIFVQDPSMIRPAMMVILCSTLKSYENAIRWVATDSARQASHIHAEVLFGQSDAPDNLDGFYVLMQSASQVLASKTSYAIEPAHSVPARRAPITFFL